MVAAGSSDRSADTSAPPTCTHKMSGTDVCVVMLQESINSAGFCGEGTYTIHYLYTIVQIQQHLFCTTEEGPIGSKHRVDLEAVYYVHTFALKNSIWRSWCGNETLFFQHNNSLYVCTYVRTYVRMYIRSWQNPVAKTLFAVGCFIASCCFRLFFVTGSLAGVCKVLCLGRHFHKSKHFNSSSLSTKMLCQELCGSLFVAYSSTFKVIGHTTCMRIQCPIFLCKLNMQADAVGWT